MSSSNNENQRHSDHSAQHHVHNAPRQAFNGDQNHFSDRSAHPHDFNAQRPTSSGDQNHLGSRSAHTTITLSVQHPVEIRVTLIIAALSVKTTMLSVQHPVKIRISLVFAVLNVHYPTLSANTYPLQMKVNSRLILIFPLHKSVNQGRKEIESPHEAREVLPNPSSLI